MATSPVDSEKNKMTIVTPVNPPGVGFLSMFDQSLYAPGAKLIDPIATETNKPNQYQNISSMNNYGNIAFYQGITSPRRFAVISF